MPIRSRLRAITSKPLPELVGRAGAAVSLRFERLRYRAGKLAPPDRLRRALKQSAGNPADLLASRRNSRPVFLPSLARRDEIRELFAERYRAELELARTWSDRARRHEVHLFGRVHKFDRHIAWHVDPVTRRKWPRVFHGDVLTSSADGRYGDVKDVWELSRQQFLVDLGKTYFLDGKGEASAEVRQIVRSWIADNPYACGVNWASPLEPAYRAISWLWAYEFVLDDPEFSADDHTVWLESFLDHARFLYRHLELYSSPFNHLIGEAAALYILGVMFPEFSEALAWKRRGRRILEARLPQQFYGDGGTVEQATLYHHATLGFYLLAALVGRSNREEFSQAVWDAIERAIEFAMCLVQPDGELPRIGDTDDARPIQLERKPFFDFRAYQAVGAALFRRSDFKTVAGHFHEDALWLLGPDGLHTYDRLDAALPARRSVALKSSGYFVLRSDWSPAADYVCFDCGEQAGGLRVDDVPSAAHGHADCLSVIVFLRGRPILVDPGFYTYNGNERWERYFRETAAHNTARINGRDQARHLEKMSWIEAPRARVEHWAEFDSQGYVCGSHDGFVKRSGIVHRRYVWYRPCGYVILFDEFTGAAERHVDINFQFAPMELVTGDTSLHASDAAMYWTATFPLRCTVFRGGKGPDEGWVAPSLGRRAPAPRAQLEGRMEESEAGVLTVLVRPELRVIVAEPGLSTLKISVEGPNWTDEVIAQPSRRLGEGAFGESALAVSRLQDGVVIERRSIGAITTPDPVEVQR